MTLIKTHDAADLYDLARLKVVPRDEWPMLSLHNSVVTKGTFDILHGGHLALIAYCSNVAKSLEGGRVIVIVESDLSVTARKGADRPFQNESRRVLQIALLGNVDSVLVCARDELAAALQAVHPRYYVKGMDTAAPNAQRGDETQMEVDIKNNPELAVLSTDAKMIVFTDDGTLSSSSIVKKIRASGKGA